MQVGNCSYQKHKTEQNGVLDTGKDACYKEKFIITKKMRILSILSYLNTSRNLK